MLRQSQRLANILKEVKELKLLKIFSGLAILAALFFAVRFLTFSPGNQSQASKEQSSAPVVITKTSSLIEQSVSEDGIGFEVFAQEANPQMKVIANNSDEPSVNVAQSPQQALADVIEYDVSHVASLRARAIAFGLISSDEKAESWVVEEGGKTYLNNRGQEVADKLATYLAGAEADWVEGKKLGSVKVDGIHQGEAVVNNTAKTYDGWNFLEVKTADGKKHYVSAWCGNNAYPPGETPPGVPEHPLPDPPGGSGGEKDSGKNPVLNPTAPIGGGMNEDKGPGKPSEAPTPPASYNPPPVPQAQPEPKAQESKTQSSNWTGAGSFTDSNGKTEVKDNGEAKTPQGEILPPLTQTPPPPVQPGAGEGNGSLPEPPSDENDW